MTACSQSSVLRPFTHLFVQHILSVRHGPGLPLLLAHGGWGEGGTHHLAVDLQIIFPYCTRSFYCECWRHTLFRLQERQWLSSRGHGGEETLVYSRLEWFPSRGYGLVGCPAPCFPLENCAGWFEEKRRHSLTEKYFAGATFIITGVSFIFVEDDI